MSENFKSQEAKDLFDYWLRLQKSTNKQIPSWSDFDPSAIKSLLPHLVLHDLRSENDSLVRLMGTDVAHRLGSDLTGKSYLSIVPPDRQAIALEHLHRVADHPCAMRVTILSQSASGISKIQESFGVPLAPPSHDDSFAYPDRPYLLFSNMQLRDQDQPSHNDVNEPLTHTAVLSRDYLDIGAGVPDMLLET